MARSRSLPRRSRSGVSRSLPRRMVRVAMAGAALSGALGGVGVASARRRWATGDDPTEGEPLRLPPLVLTRVTSGDGALLHVVSSGAADGPPVLLAHGWTSDHRVWAPVARRLVDAGHRVVLYDQRGHGSSTIGTAGLTIDALADDLRAVLEHLDLRDAVVAGHSMGGMATQRFCIDFPEVCRQRVIGIALVATAGDGMGGPAIVNRVTSAVVGHDRVGRLLADARRGSVLVRGAVGRRPVQAHLDAVREAFVATPGAVRSGLLGAIQVMDLTAELASLEVATVIVSGTHDRVTPPARSHHLAKVLPGARLEIVDHAGHMLPFEAPDRVASLIAELSRGTSSSNLLTDRARIGSPGQQEASDGRPR